MSALGSSCACPTAVIAFYPSYQRPALLCASLDCSSLCPASTLFSGPLDSTGLCVHPSQWSLPSQGACTSPIRPLLVGLCWDLRLKNQVGLGTVKVNVLYIQHTKGEVWGLLVRLAGRLPWWLSELGRALHCHQLWITAWHNGSPQCSTLAWMLWWCRTSLSTRNIRSACLITPHPSLLNSRTQAAAGILSAALWGGGG